MHFGLSVFWQEGFFDGRNPFAKHRPLHRQEHGLARRPRRRGGRGLSCVALLDCAAGAASAGDRHVRHGHDDRVQRLSPSGAPPVGGRRRRARAVYRHAARRLSPCPSVFPAARSCRRRNSRRRLPRRHGVKRHHLPCQRRRSPVGHHDYGDDASRPLRHTVSDAPLSG